MSEKTDSVLLELQKTKKVGRPKYDVAEIVALKKQGYSTRYIHKHFGPSPTTQRRALKEAIEKGIMPAEDLDIEKLEKQALDFNEATKIGMGLDYGFLEDLKTHTIKYQSIFNFTEKVWRKLGSPSIISLRNRNSPAATNFAQAFLQMIAVDPLRQRRRKKMIRPFFRFIGREDINNNKLRMTEARDPIEVREVPEIEFLDFPLKLDAVIDDIGQRGPEWKLIPRLKLATMMRTGKGSEDRELWGVKRGANGQTFLVMHGPDEYSFKVKAKMNENRVISWMPREVRQALWETYQARKDAESLISIDVNEFRKVFKETCVAHGLPPLHLHDLRKVSITWLWVMKVPLEIAVELNCGWKDLDTAKKFYLHMRTLMTKAKREAYRANIPAWFKEGLDAYVEQ